MGKSSSKKLDQTNEMPIDKQAHGGSLTRMGTRAVHIVPMKQAHIGEVVSVHLASFPGFFLTFLGPRFLHLLYTEIIQFPGNVAYVACDRDGRLIGFVAGVENQSEFYRHLIGARLFCFMAAVLGAALRRPLIVLRLLRALTYPSQMQKAAAQAVLMSIAVRPEVSGRGIGRELVRCFMGEMREQGVKSISLTTDVDDNEHVNRFYQKLGFEVVRTYVTPEGRHMYEYLIDLQAESIVT